MVEVVEHIDTSLRLPNWPAVLDAGLAASYVGLGLTSFRKWAARNGIRRLDFGLAVSRWRRADLDRAIQDCPTRSGDDLSDISTAIEAAVAAVRQRNGGGQK